MIVKRSEFKCITTKDTEPEVSYLRQPEYANRFKQYVLGEFHFIGVQATVNVPLQIGGGMGVTVYVPVTTPGVWSLESDMSKDDLNEQFEFECNFLCAMLKDLGAVTVEI